MDDEAFCIYGCLMMMMMLKYFLVNTTSGIVSPLPVDLEGGGWGK